MNPAQRVFDRYSDIVERCGESGRPTRLSDADRFIWYVVSARCEMDMEGFESVFDQLLTEDELLFLIESLDRLPEPKMADAFRRAHDSLRRAGFYDAPGRMCCEFGPELVAELAEIETFFVSDQNAPDLDRKLSELID